MILGHDVELAVLDEKGKAVSAHRWFPPKEEPLYTGYTTEGWRYQHRDAIFRDGTSLEINTPSGLGCIGYVLNSTQTSIHVAESMLPPGYRLEALSAYRVREDLGKAPPDVLNSGCSPVRNAYEGWEERPIFMDPRSKLRYAGGHIHMSGWAPVGKLDEGKVEAFLPEVVKWMDLLLGVPMVYIGIEGKAGKKRRRVYGKAGEYRWQHYKGGAKGLEYRVLGPEWLREDGLAGLTLMLARGAAYAGARRIGAGKKVDEKMLGEARAGINEGETGEVWRAAAYQLELGEMLRYEHRPAYRMAQQATPAHFEMMREKKERLFGALTLQKHPAGWDHHWSFPDCLAGWEKA